MADYEIRRFDWEQAREDAYEVRRVVFIEEQEVPEEMELDGKDGDAIHFVAYDGDGDPVGTARLRFLEDGAGKAERVAVRADHREQGLGRRLMGRLEEVAKDHDRSRIVLHAQTQVEEFYSSLGYRTTSDVFDEAGIPHVEMEKELDD